MKKDFLPFLLLVFLLSISKTYSQPMPCGTDAAMTSFCANACVVCDIDGFAGVNNLTAQGQILPQFCTTVFNNMQYIAFIAGSVDLSIRVDVGNCTGGGGLTSLELGFYESFDCVNFTAITDCDTDIQQNTSQTFSNIVPLVVGQYYYMVIDGSNSSNCQWVFHVIEGSTDVSNLESSGEITGSLETCPDLPTTFSTTEQVGAALYNWTINGLPQSGFSPVNDLSFPEDGVYEVCVSASNACDQAPPSCQMITVRSPQILIINEVLCQGECVEANGMQFCETGIYEEIITLSNGCDSIIMIDIEVLEQTGSTIDVWICNGTSFFIENTAYDQTGSYRDTILTSYECDSIVLLNLLVIDCEIVGSSDEIPVVCNGTASGNLLFSVEQGEPPLTYIYTNIMNTAITGTGTTNLLENNEIPNLSAGTYQIYISDNFGNDVVVLQEVTEPTLLEASITAIDYNGFGVSCFSSNGIPGNDGSLTANVSGGIPPYFYIWSDGQTSQTISNLTAQEYTLVLTDAVSCSIDLSFTITSPDLMIPAVDFRNPSCDGLASGEIEVLSVTGGTPPYLYALENDAFLNNALFLDLLEGNYQLSIQDSNGCIEVVESEITAPDIPVIHFIDEYRVDLGNSIQIRPFLNNSSVAEITWTNSTTLNCSDCLKPMASPLETTDYQLTIISDDGCETTEMVRVHVVNRMRVYVPNVFSPNHDGVNDNFLIFAGNEVASIVHFRVFNRWGSVVFEQKDFAPNSPGLGWNGTYKGEALAPATFVWTAEISFIDGKNIVYSGNVVLLD